jgi:hypothetical protein
MAGCLSHGLTCTCRQVNLGAASGTRLSNIRRLYACRSALSVCWAVVQVAKARAAGQRVIGEPVASGLALDESWMWHPNFTIAAQYVMSPPIRSKPHSAALKAGLAGGVLQLVATDHAVFNSTQKAVGSKDFRIIPNGVNGLEERMHVVWEEMVVSGEGSRGQPKGAGQQCICTSATSKHTSLRMLFACPRYCDRRNTSACAHVDCVVHLARVCVMCAATCVQVYLLPCAGQAGTEVACAQPHNTVLALLQA